MISPHKKIISVVKKTANSHKKRVALHKVGANLCDVAHLVYAYIYKHEFAQQTVSDKNGCICRV